MNKLAQGVSLRLSGERNEPFSNDAFDANSDGVLKQRKSEICSNEDSNLAMGRETLQNLSGLSLEKARC